MQLARLSGLTPIGSVWIVEVVVEQKKNINAGKYWIEVREGMSYSDNSGTANSSNIITIAHDLAYGQQVIKLNGTVDSGTAVYVVSSTNTSGYICLGGTFYNMTQVANLLLRATRIA